MIRNDGDWQDLDDPIQDPRYVFLAYLLKDAGSVLDLGCGEAVLRRWLDPSVNYLGVEPSAEAVAGAPPDVFIVQQPIERAVLDRTFDAVVCTEMLYYLDDPSALIRRCAQWMPPSGGRLICSIYQRPSRGSLRRGLRDWWFGTNRQTERIVRRALQHQGWPVISDLAITVRGSVPVTWHIWACAVPGKKTAAPSDATQPTDRSAR